MDVPPPRRTAPAPRRLPRGRVLAAIGAGAVVAGLAIGMLVRLTADPDQTDSLGVARPSSPSATPRAISEATPGSSASPSVEASPPASDPAGPDPSPLKDLLPVKGSGRQIGGDVLMAAGMDGELYVAIPTGAGEVLTLLDRNGRSRSGWPIVVTGNDLCDLLLAAPDGSVRVLCYRSESVDGLGASISQAHAFDRGGDPLPGWPGDVSETFTGVMVDDALVLLSRPYPGDAPEAGAPEYVHMDVVEADGAMRSGVDIPFECCDNAFAIGPDGMATVSTRDWAESGSTVMTTVVAFDEHGVRDGWPVTIDGSASEGAFDPSGRLHLVVSAPYERPSRQMVIDPDGRQHVGSDDLDIVSSLTWDGAGDPYPGAPIVASNGSTFIVSTEEVGTTIMGLDAAGRPLPASPYRSKLGLQFIDGCEPDETGCGSDRTPIGIDSRDVLYLIHEAASSSAGGSVIAIGPDGRIRDGWPVGLRRAGSMFWGLAVNSDGGAYALAIEPEGDIHSATIVAIADDSTVRYTTTIVEP
jgi:hypothetical protein